MKHRLRDVLIGLGVGILITFAFTVKAERVTYTAPEEPSAEPEEVLIEVQVDWTKERIAREVHEQAEKYGVSAKVMQEVIACESMGSTTIQSYHRRPDGSREQSFGLVQIHLPDWPEVSYEDATNPAFAIRFLAEKLSEGRGNLWTCYRNL